jgi:hypothetical protein
MTTPGWLSTLLFVLAPSTAVAAQAPVEFSHGNWQLVCDNTRTCRAAGYSEDGSEQSASVLITRQAGAGQGVTVQVQVAEPEEDSAPSGALHLQLGGVDKGALETTNNQTGIYTLSNAQANALLHTVTRVGPINLVDGVGQQWQVSDNGANAVLLKMDDAQGRIGTPGALLRKGNKREADVLPALPAPRITKGELALTTDADRALSQSPALLSAVRAALKPIAQECWRNDDDQLTADDIQVNRLTGDTVLVSAPCWMAAYNSADVFWTTPATAPYRLTVVTMQANHYADGELIASHKGRGVGDCWSQDRWQWDGKTFVASSSSHTGKCRGQPGGFWELPSLVTEIGSAGISK